jgi:hypothetical protein
MAIGFGGLDDTLPADTAFIGDGAGQIRGVKQALNTAFPAVTGEITKPTGYGTAATTQPTQADYSLLFTDMSELTDETANARDIPIGTIIAWSGDYAAQSQALSDNGWVICDGSNGSPNLVGKFIKGSLANGSDYNTGGSPPSDLETTTSYVLGTTTDKTITKTYRLQDTDIPLHSHKIARAGGVTPDGDGNLLGSDVTASAALRYGITGPGAIGDSEYLFGGISGVQPDVFQSSSFGSETPNLIDLGLTTDQFEHSHRIDATAIEPPHLVLIYLYYKGRS